VRSGAAVLAPGPLAAAEAASASCEVLCIHASNEGEGVDPELKDVKELKRPPFAGYKSYRLLTRPKLELALGKPAKAKLTDKHTLVLTFQELLKEGKGERLLLHILVPPKELDTTLKLRNGGMFYLAGFKYKAGILILGVRCSKK
jgi:hypothetical protein